MKNLLYIGNNLSAENKTPTTVETLGRLLTLEGFNVKVASSKPNKLMRLLDMFAAVYKSRKNVDYVLIDTYSTVNFYYAFLVSQLCRILRLKYIPILHGGKLPERLSSSVKLSQLIFNNAYKNVAPSLYTKSRFEGFGYTNVICIPNSIELKDYSFKARVFDTVNLLWVRSFSRLYNPLLAIDILKFLKDEGIDSRLCMIGPDNDGSLEEAKNHARKLSLEVEFTGILTKKQWHKKAKDFNIFINTTNIDNTPVSVIEAMALGLPVVSTNVGGLPFLIRNGVDGVLVEPNDINTFTEAIKYLIGNSENILRITEAARLKVEEFDWEVVKGKWISLLS
ncbi:glycosyltransferase family 4 protein [uncultured Algibacter sp.]|uniref:glycosyltransferase family 4 protein n=1 Tax=uncultured Algibacter sp. TaxID=298659 RepID=UPI002635EDD5|nr:glycosyltransferase family 4 protein [uncultured Algibacter sp.]